MNWNMVRCFEWVVTNSDFPEFMAGIWALQPEQTHSLQMGTSGWIVRVAFGKSEVGCIALLPKGATEIEGSNQAFGFEPIEIGVPKAEASALSEWLTSQADTSGNN